MKVKRNSAKSSQATAPSGDSWYEAYRPFLLLVARQYVANHADAEDVIQEGLLRFYRWGQNAAENPRTYLAACVRRAALDLRAAGALRQKKESTYRESIKPDEALLESPLEREEERQAVEKALRELSEEQREVVVLKLWGDLSFPEIGQVTNVSQNTAASRYRYGLAALKARLEGALSD